METRSTESPDLLIRRVIQRHRSSVRSCYNAVALSKPDVSGKVTVRFVIGPEGAVSSPFVHETTVGDSELEDCVLLAVKTFRFPRVKDRGLVVVTYPFNEAPEARY